MTCQPTPCFLCKSGKCDRESIYRDWDIQYETGPLESFDEERNKKFHNSCRLSSFTLRCIFSLIEIDQQQLFVWEFLKEENESIWQIQTNITDYRGSRSQKIPLWHLDNLKLNQSLIKREEILKLLASALMFHPISFSKSP